jgi:hypothetical protein
MSVSQVARITGMSHQRLAFIPVLKMTVGKDAGKKEPSYTADGNVNYYNHSGKKFGGYLKI